MKRKIQQLVSVMLCLLLLCGTLTVFAAPVDTSRHCSLALTYAADGVAFEGLEVALYRVAKMETLGVFEAVKPFKNYAIHLNGVTSQTEWNEIAATLNGYIQADNLLPTATATTDKDGTASFDNLEVGLYLVGGVIAETDSYVYTFSDFMICLPDEEAGELTYDVVARPKSEKSEPVPQEKEYTILKLWKDEGHSNQRPSSITVDILQNGALAQTVVLNAANDWTYTFTCPDGKSQWTVAERNVPDGYTVKTTQRETTFVLINTYEGEQPDTPATGDTRPWRYGVLVLCVAGLIALILGIGLGRKDDATKK